MDGRRGRLRGTIERVSAPSKIAWLILGAVFAALTGLLLARRRQSTLRTACIVLGAISAGATLVAAAGFSAASTAREEVWLESGNEVVILLVGMVFLVRGLT